MPSVPNVPVMVPSSPRTETLARSEQAIDQVEMRRMRGLMSGIAISSAIAAGIVFIVRGEANAMRVHAAALIATAISAGVSSLWFHRDVAKWIVISQIAVLMTGFYFWGFFSAYCALVPLTVYILAGVASLREIALGVGTLVAAQTAFGIATVLDVIDSRSLVEPIAERAPVWGQLVALGMLQVITIGAAVAGRAARLSGIEVLESHNKALVELARREAQLAEAYADARAARDAAVGGDGRFTEHTIDGFKLGQVLGRGAMGEVYAADRTDDASSVAMKILAPHLLRDPTARDRFVRESAIVSALKSPHVVRVVAVSPADAPLPYIVMERLDGIDLGQLLKRQPILPLDEIEQITKQVAAGLDAAHKAGIIHRDLKPSNIYGIGEAGSRTWKIVDFGASKWRDGDGTLTQDAIVGTPGYMSPEQALGHAIDQRSDVYSFGVIIYRLLTGVPAVVPGEVPAMLQEVAYRMPVQPSKRAKVMPELEAVLAVALAKLPMHRFATAGELAYAFSTAVAGKLDRGIAHRAEVLIADAPWGAWVK